MGSSKIVQSSEVFQDTQGSFEITHKDATWNPSGLCYILKDFPKDP